MPREAQVGSVADCMSTEMTDFLDGSSVCAARPVAERVGFEPTDGCPSLVFKTSAIDRSAISPVDLA